MCLVMSLNLSTSVFLDSALSADSKCRSYLFQKPLKQITAFRLEDVSNSLDQVQRLSDRFWLAGYVRYESSFAFLPLKLKQDFKTERMRPLLWFGVYKRPKVFHCPIDDLPPYDPIIDLKFKLSYAQYRRLIADIKDQIREGNTYQVNYTFDILVQAGCSPETLYFYLRQFQRTPYCAYIDNAYEQILSFSPELFFQRDGQKIWTRPMKGTSARGKTHEDDERSREGLKSDAKNRAENLMIVDLLRNDLGRICKTGTVSAPSMFDVETHPTVHQMTSLIEGQLQDGMTYPAIFQSLFPCGSVTGAPKINTMQIIRRVEQGVRGVYCGAIGYISPKQKSVFSVPIRILQRAKHDDLWQYRVGSGIVWDSSARAEWDEVKLKASFLTASIMPDVEIVETMLWDGQKILFLHDHLLRMKCAARDLAFVFDRDDCRKLLSDACARLRKGGQMLLRLLLSKQGGARLEKFQLTPAPSIAVVAMSERRLDPHNLWLRYKTTYRPWYDDAMVKIKKGLIWDEFFLNERDEICEGARSNIFIEKDGALCTPPPVCGLLPGILRAKLLKRGQCQEKVIFLKDLRSADKVYCGNSVRGLTQVRVL